MKIFDDFERTDPKPSAFSEPIFDFLNRIKNDEYHKVRALIETWFSFYPNANKSKLKQDFKGDFHGALFELFIYSFFRNLRLDVIVDPEVYREGKLLTPDFLVGDSKKEFYVEATVVRDLSKTEEAQENIKNSILDTLARVDSPNFLLDLSGFELKVLGKSPTLRGLRRFIEQKVKLYDPDQVIEELRMTGKVGPFIEYETDEFLAVIGLIAKDPGHRISGNAIGVSESGAHFPTVALSIRKSIENKAKKYRNLGAPLIISINNRSTSCLYTDEILDILFGKEMVHLNTDTLEVVRYSRKRDGIWFGPSGARNKHISAIFLTTLNTAVIHNPRYNLYLNPKADYPLELQNVRSMSFSDNGLIQNPGKEAWEILGLTPTWIEYPWQFDI